MMSRAKTFSRSTLPIAALAVGAAVLIAGAPASARQAGDPPPRQQPGNPAGAAPSELAPPVPTPPQKLTTNYMAILEAIVLAALVIGVNFIPSKRGHQD